MSEQLLKKIEKLKGFLAHKNANLSTAELLDMLCDLGIEKWDKAIFAAPRKSRALNNNSGDHSANSVSKKSALPGRATGEKTYSRFSH